MPLPDRPLTLVLVAPIVLGLSTACGGPDDAGSGSTPTPSTVAAELASPMQVGDDPSPPGSAESTATATSIPSGFAHSVVLVTVDTLRADALGFMGNREVATPALDRLAAEGLVFERAHAHNVMTLPSHANILSGRLPFEHGVRDNAGFRFPAESPSLAVSLRQAGFATAAVVGAFPLDARFGLDRGFDLYDDAYPEGSASSSYEMAERPGSEVVERGLDWWRRHDDRRRFLWLHLFDPHAPYAAPPPWGTRHADSPYLGEVAAVDAYLAPLLEQLRSEAEPVLLVFTSDHGEALGEHGESTHGLFAYEPTLWVPLVLWSPPALLPERRAVEARHVDLAPTVFAATGIEPPDDLAGRSLLDVRKRRPGDPETYFEALGPSLNRGWAPLRGILRDGWKYIELPLPELYDLDADPRESRNRHDAEPERVTALASELPQERDAVASRGPIDEEERRNLAALGYVVDQAAERPDNWGPEDDPKNLVELDRRVHEFVERYQTGRLDEAERIAREVIERRPSMGLGYYHLAQVLLDQGRLREAIEVMGAAHERDVATPGLTRQLALTLTEVGAAPRAAELLAPLAGDDAEVDTLVTYGLVLAEAGRLAEARSTLERVFEIDPRNPEARQNLALVALHAAAWPECERQARRAIELNEALPLAWNYLGIALYNQGRFPEALDAWRRSIELGPGDFDVLYNFALVAAERGASDARPALERFIAQAPPERYAPDIARARELLRRLP